MSKSNKSNGSQDDNGDYVIDRCKLRFSPPVSRQGSSRGVKNSYDVRSSRKPDNKGTFDPLLQDRSERQHFLFHHHVIHFPPTYPLLILLVHASSGNSAIPNHFPILQELNSYPSSSSSDVFRWWWTSFWINR